MSSALAKTALLKAISQLGEEEKPRGSNWGIPVEIYLARVKINFPASWCMAFVYWAFDESAIQLNIENPLIQTGGVLHAWNLAKADHAVKTPQEGDIFIMDFGNGTGHTGIVKGFSDTHIDTVEGNTNDTGGREGFEVCLRSRNIKSIKGYLRY